MAEEEKSQKVVETYKAVAAGIASVLAAVFTSKLGVAGTLIGTALTATMITLIAAILKAQLMKASHTISGLPSAVQGRFSTQQLRIPGKPGPEPNPEPEARPGAKRGWLSGLRSRLRALPGFLRELPSAQRRRVLLAGLLAGLVATIIGLGTVTGIELAGGNTLSCLVWACPEDETASAKSSGRLGLSIFGGYSGPQTRSVPSDAPSEEQWNLPKNNQQVPQQRQPAGQPAQPDYEQPAQSDTDEGASQQRFDETPRDAGPAQQSDTEPEPAKGSETKSPPSDEQQSPPKRGQAEDQVRGTKKEDRG